MAVIYGLLIRYPNLFFLFPWFSHVIGPKSASGSFGQIVVIYTQTQRDTGSNGRSGFSVIDRCCFALRIHCFKIWFFYKLACSFWWYASSYACVSLFRWFQHFFQLLKADILENDCSLRGLVALTPGVWLIPFCLLYWTVSSVAMASSTTYTTVPPSLSSASHFSLLVGSMFLILIHAGIVCGKDLQLLLSESQYSHL